LFLPRLLPTRETTSGKWNIGSLAPGASGIVVVEVKVKTPLPDGTHLLNSVHLDSDDDSASAKEVTLVQSNPTLSVSKKDSGDPVQPGENLTYTIHYSNASDATETATNVVLTETYDPNVAFVSAIPSPDAGDNQWNIGTLAPGQSGSVLVTVKVKELLPDGTHLLNRASLDSDDDSAAAKEITLVHSSPKLSVAKKDSADPVKAGENLTYTISYSNASNTAETAANAVLTETYDPDATFVSATPSPDAGTDNRWTLGDLAPGDFGAVEVTVKVNKPLPDGTHLRNRAYLTSDDASAAAQEVTLVQSSPGLSVSKADSPDPVKSDRNLVYTISYSNGPDAAETASNVTVTEVYDPNVQFVSASPAPDEGNNRWNVGDLAPGESGAVVVTVKPKTGLPDGTHLRNLVHVDSDDASASAEETTTVHAIRVECRSICDVEQRGVVLVPEDCFVPLGTYAGPEELVYGLGIVADVREDGEPLLLSVPAAGQTDCPVFDWAVYNLDGEDVTAEAGLAFDDRCFLFDLVAEPGYYHAEATCGVAPYTDRLYAIGVAVGATTP